jgi:hypothetical protein
MSDSLGLTGPLLVIERAKRVQAMNDNEMFDLQRIKALETAVAKMRKDLARVTTMLGHTRRSSRLVKQKGAIEKLIFLAQAEIGKIRKRCK